jgi:hypothetical protein
MAIVSGGACGAVARHALLRRRSTGGPPPHEYAPMLSIAARRFTIAARCDRRCGRDAVLSPPAPRLPARSGHLFGQAQRAGARRQQLAEPG